MQKTGDGKGRVHLAVQNFTLVLVLFGSPLVSFLKAL